MANPEHVEIVRGGAASIAAWREQHPRESLDLCHADLGGCDLRGAALLMARLTGADLSEALLAGADLRSCTFTAADLRAAELAEASASGASFGGADLRAAVMNGIDLRGAELLDADLSDAHLAGGDLRAAHLHGADLRRADLRESDLRRSDLRGALFADAVLTGALLGEADLCETSFARTALDGADFEQARCGWTQWLDVDLSATRGLESLRHVSASTVGTDTLYRSRGRIPAAFLRGCGVPENLVANVEPLARRSAAYHSCFLGYSPRDEAFVRQLHDRLHDRGIRCWLKETRVDSVEDGVPRLFSGLRRWDKVLLCASESLLSTPAAHREIDVALALEEQIAGERGVGVELLLLVDLDGGINSPAADAVHGDVLRRRVVADFTHAAQDAARFEQQFEQLVRVLTASPGSTDRLTLAEQALEQLRLVAGRAEGLQSGFDHLVRNDGGNNVWYNFRGEKVRSHHLRQLTAGSLLEWETVPAAVEPGAEFVNFVFPGAMGYRSQPKTDGFAFTVNGRHTLDFDLARDAHGWHTPDERVTLLYVPRWSSREDTAGFFYVALARDLVTPGQPLRFAVRAKGADSLRWFSLHPETNAVELQVEPAGRSA
ncbi:MAG TPA: toll/interleukin-1 receptor domain-containing protein [Planctomycetaceae bacterium]|nr:toll/interleukin-1 receptor domain-containing protein [Planctomycetaceae bacterium]